MFTHDAKVPKAAFTLTCDKAVQVQGDQSQRVFGELAADGKAVRPSSG
jgi:translation initiation factor 1 (eIF-1/SUI1)